MNDTRMFQNFRGLPMSKVCHASGMRTKNWTWRWTYIRDGRNTIRYPDTHFWGRVMGVLQIRSSTPNASPCAYNIDPYRSYHHCPTTFPVLRSKHPNIMLYYSTIKKAPLNIQQLGGLYTWSGFIVRFLYGFVESTCTNLYQLYQSRSLTSTKHHLNILDKDQLNQLDDFESLSSYQLHSTSSSHRSLSCRFLATLSLPFPLSRPGGFWEVRLFGPSCLAFI